MSAAGQEPPDWLVETVLGSVSLIMDYRGRTPRKLGMTWGDGTIPALSARNVRMGRIDFSEECYFGSDALYRRWMTKGDMQEGDVLVTTEAPLGNVAAVPDRRKYILSQRTVLLRPDPTRFDGTYFLKFLQSPRFQQTLLENATGSTALGIQRRRLERLVIYRPPLQEQRQIGAALADADHLVAMLERLIAKKQAVKRGMMQQLLAGGTRLQGFTAPWRDVPIAQAGMILDNLRVPLSAAERADRTGPYPYCGANGVLDYIDDFMIDDDVILLAEDGGNFDQYQTRPIAYRMAGKIWVNNHAHVLRGAFGNDTGFLFYALEHKDITPYISSGTRSKLTRGELVRITVAMPQDLDEQRAIATVLRDADHEIRCLKDRRSKAQAIKQGMMQELLTGRTRLTVLEAAA